MILRKEMNISQLVNSPPHLLIYLLCLGLLFYREPDGFLNPQFWAEDGVICFGQSLTLGWSAIWEPQAGYLILIPRLVAYLGSFFPISWAPTLYNFSFVILILFVISSLLSSRIPLPFKPLLAIAIVLVPSNGEILMSIVNIQWFLAVVLILVIIQEKPNTTHQWLLDTFMITTIGLTGPFIILFFPLFIFRLIYICRSYYSVYLLFMALLLSLVQGYWIVMGGNLHSGNHLGFSFTALEQVLALRFSGMLFFGDYISLAFNVHVLAGMTIIVIAGLMTLAMVEPHHRRLPVIVFLIGGFLVTFASFYKFRYNPFLLVPFDNGARYFYLPHLLIVWSFIMFLDSKKITRSVSILLLLMVLFSKLTHFQVAPLKDFHWERYSSQIERGEIKKIPINPKGWFIFI